MRLNSGGACVHDPTPSLVRGSAPAAPPVQSLPSRRSPIITTRGTADPRRKDCSERLARPTRGTRRWASASSNSHSSSSSAPASRIDEALRAIDCSLFRSIASRLSNDEHDTARPVARSIKQAGAAEALEVLDLRQDRRLEVLDALVNLIRGDLSPRSPAHRHRHSCGGHGAEPRSPTLRPSRRCRRTSRQPVAKRLCLLGARAHRLLGLPGGGDDATAGLPVDQQPTCRYTRPSSWSAGMTSSRTCAIPASIDDGCAWIVVERAYTIHPLLFGAAPRWRHRTTHQLPPAEQAIQWVFRYANGDISVCK